MRRVAVIGGGPSGLAAAKELRAAGIECVLIDRLRELGGRWAASPHSFCYDSLRANISREMLGFSDFPVASDFPDYPTRAQVLAYLHSYARAHDLHACAQLGYEVEGVSPVAPERPDTPWRVRARALPSRDASRPARADIDTQVDAVLICTGPYARPRWPDCPLDDFRGRLSHAGEYRNAARFDGARVLVVGASASACDIASELARSAERVTMAVRSPFWLVARHDAHGRPTDHGLSHFKEYLPDAIRNPVATRLISRAHLPLAAHGLPVPTTPFDATRLVQSAQLPQVIREGLLDFRPALSSAAGSHARFADGSRLEVDEIICCTGYHPDPLTWLASEAVPPALRGRGQRLQLERHILSPRHDTLGFIGHLQIQGPSFPVMEMQARWVAARLCGRLASPSELPTTRIEGAAGVLPAVRYLRYMDLLARELGCRPQRRRRLLTQPRLFLRLFDGPAFAPIYRLDGPGRWDGAEAALLAPPPPNSASLRAEVSR